MIRVLHTFNGLHPSGAERMMACSRELWREMGVDPIILGLGRDHPFAEDLTTAGYQVELLESARSVTGLAALARATIRLRPDVVHLHAESMFAPMTLAVRATPSVRLIVRSIHSVFGLDKPASYRRTRRRRFSLAQSMGMQPFACSSAVAENELAAFGVQADVVENWVDTRSFADIDSVASSRLRASWPAPRGATVVALVGNCGEEKNHELVMRAALHSDARVYVVHVGSERRMSDAEHNLAEELEARGHLTRLGSRNDVNVLLTASDAVVVPSRYEGFSLVAAEALCAGVPLLATSAPGLGWLREFITPRLLTAEPEKWVEAMNSASTMRRALAAQLEIDRQRALDRFSADRGTRAWAEIYHRIDPFPDATPADRSTQAETSVTPVRQSRRPRWRAQV